MLLIVARLLVGCELVRLLVGWLWVGAFVLPVVYYFIGNHFYLFPTCSRRCFQNYTCD